VTPVGNVVSDAVPDRTAEAEDVAVILLDVLGDGVSVALNVDVFEPVLDAVIVLVAPAVFEITAVGEPVVETDEVLLDDALPLVVGDDVDDRDARPDSVSIEVIFDDTDALVDSDNFGDMDCMVAELTDVAVLTTLREADADSDGLVAPDAVYDRLPVEHPVMTALDDIVLLFIEEVVTVDEILGVEDTDLVGFIGDIEARIDKECVGDPVEVLLARIVAVVMPEPEAVFDDVVDVV
jgi:hypothetical protein